MIRLFGYCVWILICALSSCSTDDVDPNQLEPSLMEIPKGFDQIDFPSDNAYTPARWKLGKRLFYDKVMSLDSSVSCASCHHADIAFSDDVPFSLGVEQRLGTRNSPSLANVAYHPYYTREGGVPSLEMQILVPIQEHNEFNFNIVLLAERLQQDSSYKRMAKLAYDRMPDAFVITRALANFERSLISGFSRYDQYENYGFKDKLTEEEIQGMELFFSDKTHCSSCHNGFNFTNYAFENNGLYAEYKDKGRHRLTSASADIGRFKVPSLRNVGLSAPYMHDGSISSLEDVVKHYNLGGQEHPNKSKHVRKLHLSNQEQNALVAFLHSLTDYTFIQNLNFKK